MMAFVVYETIGINPVIFRTACADGAEASQSFHCPVILFNLFLIKWMLMELLAPNVGLITWTAIFLVVLFFWTFTLIDITKSDFKRQGEKLYWTGLTILLPGLGSVLYYLYGRKNRIK